MRLIFFMDLTKKFRFPKLIYGMNLLLVWSIWVGWFISYSSTTPWFGWFCIYSLISTVNLVNPIFPYMTLKSGDMKFFIYRRPGSLVFSGKLKKAVSRKKVVNNPTPKSHHFHHFEWEIQWWSQKYQFLITTPLVWWPLELPKMASASPRDGISKICL